MKYLFKNKQCISVKTRIKRLLALFVIILLGMQLYRPEISYSPVIGDIDVPADVKSILINSCFDCHSNQTNLRWFDQIAPAYWVVSDHIKKGRAVLNFSEWDILPPAAQKAKLWEAFNHVNLGAMPLKSYEFMHPESKLSGKDIATLKNYISSLAPTQPPDEAKVKTYNEQYNNRAKVQDYIQIGLPTALNGISYISDYKNWQVISTTDRFDNNTIRIILGNDVAIKALKQRKNNPWPDGTILAKVAWDKLTDRNGTSTPGAFKQVEYMIKDKQRFPATEGWGFARFLSPKLEPYGKTGMFTNECINCHRPMENNDFVFTLPITH